MRHLSGFEPLSHEYDGYILDLWGVMHDGIAPYPGAIDCVAHLRAAGKRVVLLSNAPRRTRVVREGLRRMGLADTDYDDIMTSGEATRSALLLRRDPWIASLGRRVLHLGPDKDRNIFEGLDLELVPSPADAEFVLNTGPDDELGDGAVDPYLPLLRQCAGRSLPMLCANPDLEIVRGGKRIICAGMLSRHYEEFGGTVRSIGKPYPEVYETVFPMLGVAREKILAVGDALATDIAGARAAGIASCWVLGGIHAEMIGNDNSLAEAEAAGAGLAPIATVPAFRW